MTSSVTFLFYITLDECIHWDLQGGDGNSLTCGVPVRFEYLRADSFDFPNARRTNRIQVPDGRCTDFPGWVYLFVSAT